MLIEVIKFIIYAFLIVIIAKYVLVRLLRSLAEALNLPAKTVGNISGIATSMPEFLTVSFSAYAGLIGTSIYNIISSNISNLLQYIFSIILSKNQKQLYKKPIKIDLFLVGVTIALPILMIIFNIDFSLSIVPVFILLLILFYYINNNVHKLYFKDFDKKQEKEIEREKTKLIGKIVVIIKYSIYLLITSVALFIIGNALSNSLENLAHFFKIPEIILGIVLGVVTSIPELITFFESQRHHKTQKNNHSGVVEATNNLLTSNILNLFVIQTIGIIIYEIFK